MSEASGQSALGRTVERWQRVFGGGRWFTPRRGSVPAGGTRPGRAALSSWRTPLATLLLAPLTLAACGAGSESVQGVVSAARLTIAQNADTTTSLAGATAFGARATVVARGAFGFPAGIGYETIDLPAQGGQASGAAFFTFDQATAYYEPRSYATVLPRGKNWLSVPLARSPARFPRLAEQLEALNPELLLDELLWGSSAIASSSGVVVNHLPLERYVVTIALAKALQDASGAQAPAARAAIEGELAALRSDPVRSRTATITVWVSGPGLVTQLQASLPGSGLGTLTVSLSSSSAKLATSLPLAASVLPITALPATGLGALAPWVLPRWG